jgi:hypothetical protein
LESVDLSKPLDIGKLLTAIFKQNYSLLKPKPILKKAEFVDYVHASLLFTI